MRSVLMVLAGAMAIAVAAVLVHFIVIELGREVVTLRTEASDGSWKQTRLWVVDYDGDPWLHSAGEEWEQRFERNPVVELVRRGKTERYQAEPDRSAHAAIDDALREKYGLADRWVRFLAPCDELVLPVRLRVSSQGTGRG
jgi:hypothetical protein